MKSLVLSFCMFLVSVILFANSDVDNAKLSQRRLSNHIASMNGVSGSEVGLCNSNWVFEALGTPGFPNKQTVGVRINFTDKVAFLNFARSCIILSSQSTKVASNDTETIEVPVCGILK